MKKNLKRSAVLLGVVSVLALGACSNDDDNEDEATPTATATETETATPSPTETVNPKGFPVHLVCPPPIGEVDVLTSDADDDTWAPAYVVGTDQVLWPVAFGEITFTDNGTGETFTDPAETKPNTDTAGSVTCDFNADVEDVDEQGNPVSGNVAGTVAVVPYTPSPSPSASATP